MQAHALIEYWQTFPPTHEAVRAAWLKIDEEPRHGDGDAGDTIDRSGGDVPAFLGMDGVHSNWSGGPPLIAADVIRMAEEAKHGRLG